MAMSVVRNEQLAEILAGTTCEDPPLRLPSGRPVCWEAAQRILSMAAALREIQELVSWHYDPDARVADTSPADQTAHVNGLVYQICAEQTEGKSDEDHQYTGGT